ncbi:hypothetical protein L2E82_45488 [Cichorium intybus]|uniref:Uncharacterized protein n=1 Tax=Cichorium intybus TaxID=13427 RepID=A0ACB8ZUG0_CICIN|nr:hypothetical protein L2E82_45488 [Cichorium intybus]
MKTTLSTLLLAGLFLAGVLIPERVTSQNPPVNRANIVTESFFNGIVAKSSNTCRGRGFYTHATFLRVIGDYPEFARSGTIDDSKRELAAFFAHVTHETGSFCYIEEINKRDYCTPSVKYPCAPNKQYYGRGPIQLTGNNNYGAAGDRIGFNGVGNPEIVAQNPTISFKTALWFWMENVHSVVGQGFGATIRKVNGGECNGGNQDQVTSRVNLYLDYCRQFGVSPNGNQRC